MSMTLGAVWDKGGVVGYAGTSAWGSVWAGSKTLVGAVSLDTYVESRNICKVDLVKLDIEGAGLNALTGFLNTIERDHPDIVFESNTLTCGGFGYAYTSILSLRLKQGYALYRLGTSALHPWMAHSIQEVVQADFMATVRTASEVSRLTGLDVRQMSSEELLGSIMASVGLQRLPQNACPGHSRKAPALCSLAA